MTSRRHYIVGVVVTTAVVLLARPRPSDSNTFFGSGHECAFCHSTHGPPGFPLLNEEVAEVLCLSCHGPGGVSTLKADVHDNRQGSSHAQFRQTCLDCHTPHSDHANWLGGTNLKKVGAHVGDVNPWVGQIDTPNSGVRDVVFESLGTGLGWPSLYSFADNDQDANGIRDGVCEVCHTQTLFHRNAVPDPHHNTGATCTSCHPHEAGFDPVGGACTDCHSTPQDNGDGVPPGGRRAVVHEFLFSSHHVATDPIEDGDCVVCHDQSQHQQGHVRLKDVDDPGNPAAVVSLDGDPAVDPAEAAKLESFCLACHDDDAAGGQPPFSDGLLPPVIDAAMWTAAAHRAGGFAGPMTCFGDGETFGCHATGHGSMKRRLLAPSDASQPPVAGDPLREQEGMCYTCHDADGPAATDIEASFLAATHHNVSSLDQVDGSLVECTSCHNVHAANAAALLADPDSGSVDPWTGTDVDFCLSCHDGVPPAGISFPPSSDGTGFDKSAFPGTTHALVTGARGCMECHFPHGSDNVATLMARYVTDDYNQYNQGDGDYAACWLCHDEQAIINQTNRFEDRHDKHVKGEDAPCIACHNAHGPFDPGEPGLIDLDFTVNNGGYDIEFINGRDGSTSFWINAAQTQGFCYIRCHGENHTPENYNRTGGMFPLHRTENLRPLFTGPGA